MRYEVRMENSGGVLDSRLAPSLEEAQAAMINMIMETEIADGDVFRVVDRQRDD